MTFDGSQKKGIFLTLFAQLPGPSLSERTPPALLICRCVLIAASQD